MGFIFKEILKQALKKAAREATKKAVKKAAQEEVKKASKEAAKKATKKASEAAKKSQRKFSKNKKKDKQSCDKNGKCPLCGRACHDTKYRRKSSAVQQTLLRDAADPKSMLDANARAFIRATKGKRVPPGYEVSHKIPLYTLPPSRRCTLDEPWNMETMPKRAHRDLHKECGKTYHKYPVSRKPK